MTIPNDESLRYKMLHDQDFDLVEALGFAPASRYEAGGADPITNLGVTGADTVFAELSVSSDTFTGLKQATDDTLNLLYNGIEFFPAATFLTHYLADGSGVQSSNFSLSDASFDISAYSAGGTQPYVHFFGNVNGVLLDHADGAGKSLNTLDFDAAGGWVGTAWDGADNVHGSLTMGTTNLLSFSPGGVQRVLLWDNGSGLSLYDSDGNPTASLSDTTVGFFGATPQTQGPAIPDQAVAVDVDDFNDLLTYLRARGDLETP